MECTNGQLAWYRRHREQSNPKAVSRDRSGVKNNPLHHRDFYTSTDFPANQEKKRADERTRTAVLISLRVIGQWLQGVAGVCKYRISKPLSLLCIALCCTVLRSRWCQSGVKIALPSALYG
jgi:hypothetical protein